MSSLHADNDFEDKAALLGGQDEEASSRTRLSKGLRLYLRYWPWLFHFLFFLAYITSMYFSRQESWSDCAFGTERIYDDPPIKYEKVIFDQAGFHDRLHQETTIYEGQPDAANNASWDRLMSAGIVNISEEEEQRLPGDGTAHSRMNSKEYIVELEVFHQLHCLKSLRQQLWSFELGIEWGGPQRRQHFDHCIDYLRQVIMCHGDITPIVSNYDKETNAYFAHHNTVHQCRSFEKIFDWAEKRRTAHMRIDAQHKNIEPPM